MLDFEHDDANKNERMLSALPDFGGTYNAHIRDTLFVLLSIRSPSSSVFQLGLSEVGEFDRVDDLWFRVDVLRIGCCIWVCVVPMVEATIHLKKVPSVRGTNGSSVSRHSPSEGWGLDRLRRHRMNKIATQEHLGRQLARRNSHSKESCTFDPWRARRK